MTAFAATATTVHAQTNTSTNASPARPRPHMGKRYFGKIESVDSDAKTISITMKNGKTETLKIGSATKIKKDNEPATLSDATVGMTVRAYTTAADTNTASSILLGDVKPRAKTPPPANN